MEHYYILGLAAIACSLLLTVGPKIAAPVDSVGDDYYPPSYTEDSFSKDASPSLDKTSWRFFFGVPFTVLSVKKIEAKAAQKGLHITKWYW